MAEPVATILARASRAVARIDREGLRGVTMLSIREIEAMAIVLAAYGFPLAGTSTKGETK